MRMTLAQPNSHSPLNPQRAFVDPRLYGYPLKRINEAFFRTRPPLAINFAVKSQIMPRIILAAWGRPKTPGPRIPEDYLYTKGNKT